MAGTLLTVPALGATDWTAFITHVEWFRKGHIECSFTNQEATTEGQIAAGSTVEVDGALYTFTSNESITGTATAGWYGIKVIAAGATCTVAYAALASAGWTPTEQGWYAGSDRYIGSVYVSGGGYYYKRIWNKAFDNGNSISFYINDDIDGVVTYPIFYVDRTNGRACVGANNPTQLFEVKGTNAGGSTLAGITNTSSAASSYAGLMIGQDQTSDNLLIRINTATDVAEITNQSNIDGTNRALIFKIRDGAGVNEYLRLTVDGKWSTYGETAPDCGVGGLTILSTGNLCKSQTFKKADVAHGMTTIAETDTFGILGESFSAGGGLRIAGLSDVAIGLHLESYNSAVTDTRALTSASAIKLNSYYKNGTGVQAFGVADNILGIYNNDSARILVQGDGELYFLDPAVSHGFTGLVDANNFFNINHANTGVTTLSAYTETTIAIALSGLTEASDNTTSTAAVANIMMGTNKRSGTGAAALAADENCFSITNYTSCVFIVKGDGDYLTDLTAGSARGTGDYVPRYYDNENDIELIRAAKSAIGGKITDHLVRNKDRLEKLGIIKNNFLSGKGMAGLTVGAIDQLWNMIRNISKKLNISENELLEFAKDYK